MYAAAGGASLAGRKARQHGRQPAPPSPRPHSPLHPAPTGVRAYSCQHWEARLAPPARPLSAPADHHLPCDPNEVYRLDVYIKGRFVIRNSFFCSWQSIKSVIKYGYITVKHILVYKY